MTRRPILLTLIAAGTLCSCAVWRERVVLRSPSGAGAIEVQQEPLFQHVRINLLRRDGSRVRLREPPYDLYVRFAHAYWSNDAVAVLICGGAGDERIAYDLRRNEVVPFSRYAAAFNDSLVSAYGPPKDLPEARALEDPCLVDEWREKYISRYPNGYTH